MKKVEPLSLDGIKTYGLSERPCKVSHQSFGQPWEPGGSFKEFIHRLPRILAGETLREVAAAWIKARRAGRPVILGMGAHPIKVGLNPLLIDLMQRGLITGMALNGAGIIHDAEVAMVGRTSEDVDEVLGCGAFGMAKETAEFLNAAIAWGGQNNLGLGEAVGRQLLETNFFSTRTGAPSGTSLRQQGSSVTRPTRLTALAGRISPGTLVGVRPKKMQKARPVGQ